MASRRTDHDRLFEELIETFLAEFLDLFLPEARPILDLTNCRFLTQEIFSGITAGERNVIDLVAEVRLRDEPGLVLIHVENRRYDQQDFNERMFRYFSRLYEKHPKPILPVAVFAHGPAPDEPNQFEMGFPGLEVLRFQFHKVELYHLPWREYIRQDNPVAAAFLSKMGVRPEERVQVKREFLRMLVRMELDPARESLLMEFCETYLLLPLTPQEEEELQQGLQALGEEGQKVQEYINSYRQRGRLEGWAESKRESIIQFLAARFGLDMYTVGEQVDKIQDVELLNQLLLKLYTAESSEEAQDWLRKATALSDV